MKRTRPWRPLHEQRQQRIGYIGGVLLIGGALLLMLFVVFGIPWLI